MGERTGTWKRETKGLYQDPNVDNFCFHQLSVSPFVLGVHEWQTSVTYWGTNILYVPSCHWPWRDKLYFLFNTTNRRTNFPSLYLSRKSTCFGQFLCQSSGVFHCTFGNGIYHANLMTYTSAECTVENSWWCAEEQSVCMGLIHVPLNNVLIPRLLTWESNRSVKWLCSLNSAFLS